LFCLKNNYRAIEVGIAVVYLSRDCEALMEFHAPFFSPWNAWNVLCLDCEKV